MSICYIGIGSNLGERRKNISSALSRISRLKGTRLSKVSSIIETEPVGGPPQGKYLNAVAEIRTALAPRSLLNSLQEIEASLGRARAVKNGPRTIDLDILLFGNKRIKTRGLAVPHPKLKKREFVLGPLGEIAPQIVKRLLREGN